MVSTPCNPGLAIDEYRTPAVTMVRPAFYYLRVGWTKYKIVAKLKVIAVLIAIVFLIRPLRNAVVPGWPSLFRDLSTWKVIRIHVGDFFYPMDRSQYTGSCDFVHAKLAHVRMPRLEDMPFPDLKDWERNLAKVLANVPKKFHKDLFRYQPTLTPKEMKELQFATLSVAQALIAFNVSHMIMEGSLVGQWRHHGMIPWDDDTDFIFDVKQWELAKKVISCIPDIQLNIGSDFMWKAFYRKSDLWKGESFVKFPFVDLFPYNYDEEHLWPLTIWMKTDIIIPTPLALPPTKGVFEGYPMMVPGKTGPVLDYLYGKVSYDCYSRTFLRRERQKIPRAERIHLPCKYLQSVYPFVRRRKQDVHTHTVLEERMFGSKVISTFNASFHGDTLEELDAA